MFENLRKRLNAKLKIVQIHAKGGAAKESVVMTVLASGSLRNFAIVDNTFGKTGKLSNKNRHFYWFPDREVKTGETVKLYTGQGEDSSNGGLHQLYWGLQAAIWNDEKDAAVLFELVQEYQKTT